MNLSFPIEKTVKERHSVRTYENRALSAEVRNKIEAYTTGLTNPFSIDITFELLKKHISGDGEKLGTYGVIKGAQDFIAASVSKDELSLEALGYSFEELVLYATSLGLGTCWLGGTFDHNSFATAMNLKAGEVIPCISPIGYPVGKKRFLESIMSKVVKSDQRMDWSKLYFQQGFTQPLTKEEAGEYAFPLEMMRLAPSAVNKQPWRVIKDKDIYHFYKESTLKKDEEKVDIQRVDMGIGACHFHMAAMEKGLAGRFEKLATPDIQTPDQMFYTFSWIVS